MDKALRSRILEELLPLQCDACGYGFERTLAEYFDIGVKCPQCQEPIELEEGELKAIMTALAMLHGEP